MDRNLVLKLPFPDFDISKSWGRENLTRALLLGEHHWNMRLASLSEDAYPHTPVGRSEHCKDYFEAMIQAGYWRLAADTEIRRGTVYEKDSSLWEWEIAKA